MLFELICTSILTAWQGFPLPNFPQNPKTPEEQDAHQRYAKALGSAVNPVLREGNSDRRVAEPVKKHAQRSRPPVRMREWSKGGGTVVYTHSHCLTCFCARQSHACGAHEQGRLLWHGSVDDHSVCHDSVD